MASLFCEKRKTEKDTGYQSERMASKRDQNQTEEVYKWGSNEQLSTETIQFLIKEGFTSMDLLYLLTPQTVKDSIQVPHLLPLAQCLLLQKAVTRFPSVAQIDEGVRKWGESECLTAETLTELARLGIDSVSKLQLIEGLILRKTLSSLPKDTRKIKVDTERSQNVCESEDKPKPHSSRALAANAHIKSVSMDSAKELHAPKKGSVLRLLLVGKSGSGISSTGNSILGREEFRTGISSKATTEQCETKRSTRNGFTIEVIDTPGLAHPTLSNDDIAQGIFKYVSQTQSAPQVIIYVIKYGYYAEEDSEAYAALRKAFQPENYKHVILAFTYCDELERNGDTINGFVQRSGGELQKIFQECKKSFITVNNRENITTARSELFVSEIFKYLNETHQS